MARILVLEDDAPTASLYADVLRLAGNEVAFYTSFEEARAHLRREVPDGLLTDVRVGEYNGLQLALLFRSLSATGPILVVSGHDDPVIRKGAEAVNAEFLTKPVEFSRLSTYFADGAQ